MTIVRVGATKKYSDGWESAFGKAKQKSAASPTKKAGGKTSAPKASAKKKATGKKTKKK